VLLGFAVFVYLPERPEKSAWLPQDEKDWLRERLASEHQEKTAEKEQDVLQTLRSFRVWALCLIYFTLVVSMYGIALWMPLMLKSITGFSNFLVGIVSIFPYLAAAVFMVIIGILSDQTGERRLYIAGSLMLAAVGFLFSVFTGSPVWSVVCLVIAAAGIWGALGPFWAFAGSFLSGAGAASGFALINSIGNLGGFAGPWLMGLFRDSTGSYTTGMIFLGLIIFTGGIMAWLLKFIKKTDNGG
jgi:ACS family tartrate transporter-like MFS transporter